ncbi:hypothetical protein ACFLYX_03525 [Chloroflexota bacterium]
MVEAKTDNIYKRLASKIQNPLENMGDFEPAVKIFEHLLTPEQAWLQSAGYCQSEKGRSNLDNDDQY